MKKIELKNQGLMTGKYRFVTRDSITGEIKRVSSYIKNKIMLADTIGLNIFIRRLGGDQTYNDIITSAEIGKGTTPPTSADTDLEDPILTGIAIADVTIGIDNVMFSFFIPSISLPDDTYTEFNLRCGTQQFARSIISPSYAKGANENTTIEYTLTLSN